MRALKAVPMAIGERVRELRAARGLSQDQLAEAAGVQQSAISRLEREQVGDPGVMMLAGIADALKVTVDDLLGTNRLPGVSPLVMPPTPDADRLRVVEERVDLLTRVLRAVAGDQLDAALAEQAAAGRPASRTGSGAS